MKEKSFKQKKKERDNMTGKRIEELNPLCPGGRGG